MGVHLALQVDAHRLQLAHIGGEAGEARRRGQFQHIERAALAGDHGRSARIEDGAVPASSGGRLALVAVEEFESVLDHGLGVGGFDRARIGGVYPAQSAIGAARPGRMRQAGQQRRKRLMVGGERLQFTLERQSPGALAGDLAQADDGAAGDRAALGVDERAPLGAQGEAEGLAALLQSIGREFELLGLGRWGPGTIGQRQRRARRAEKAAIALEDGGGVTPFPAHHDLRIGGEQGREPVLMTARGLEFGREFRLAPVPARALTDIEDRGGRGEDGQPRQHEREAAGADQVGAQRRRHGLALGESGRRDLRRGQPREQAAPHACVLSPRAHHSQRSVIIW